MGGPAYDFHSRSTRTVMYSSMSFADTFTQVKEGKIHPSMDPKEIKFRESRDSDVHPRSYPIAFTLDVTASMLDIPQMLIKHGLPKMISKIIQKGIPSPAVLFMAAGDSQAGDEAPFQIGQFESGDAEMDMWLQRTWPEAGGGSNPGESYLWSWYFLAYHVKTDAWEKRKQKGLAISVGDEPCLAYISRNEYREVMGEPDPQLGLEFPLKAEDLLKKVQEQWDVFHIHISHRRAAPEKWKEWLGQNLIDTPDYNTVPDIVANLAIQNCSYCNEEEQPVGTKPAGSGEDIKITL